MHWSGRPKYFPWIRTIAVRTVRFVTPEGRTVSAKLFLTEFLPELIEPQGLPANPEQEAARKRLPPRLMCQGYEIRPDAEFAPDYDLPARFVTPREECEYLLDLGMLTASVRTVPAARPVASVPAATPETCEACVVPGGVAGVTIPPEESDIP